MFIIGEQFCGLPDSGDHAAQVSCVWSSLHLAFFIKRYGPPARAPKSTADAEIPAPISRVNRSRRECLGAANRRAGCKGRRGGIKTRHLN